MKVNASDVPVGRRLSVSADVTLNVCVGVVMLPFNSNLINGTVGPGSPLGYLPTCERQPWLCHTNALHKFTFAFAFTQICLFFSALTGGHHRQKRLCYRYLCYRIYYYLCRRCYGWWPRRCYWRLCYRYVFGTCIRCY